MSICRLLSIGRRLVINPLLSIVITYDKSCEIACYIQNMYTKIFEEISAYVLLLK